jgi:hypothetical protein
MIWIAYDTEDIKGKYLYKFLSRSNLEKFLSTGNIWFSRSDKFGDKLECVTIADLKKTPINIKEIEKRKKQHLIACFHEATYESLAFWDTYSKTEDDRRIYALKFNLLEFCEKITKANIKIESEKIEKQIHGKVDYKNLLSTKRSVLESKKVKHISLRKEYAFQYEREYRFVIKTKTTFSNDGLNVHIGSPKSESFKILVNPLLEDKSYISSLDFLKDKGFESKFELTKITRFFKPELAQ